MLRSTGLKVSSKSKDTHLDLGSAASIRTPVGRVEIAAGSDGISSVHFVKESGRRERVEDPRVVLRKAIRELDEYFHGKRKRFRLELSPEGTAFQKKVWSQLQRVPWGRTISYQELAARTGNSKAARAVGSAVAKNPLCILIPCHRVVKKGGGIGGFSQGVRVKEWLLRHERKWSG